MGGISLTEYHNWDIPYRFMIKGNLNHLVHEFYYVDDGDEARHAHDEYEGCLLIFENEKEHQRFRNLRYSQYMLQECYQQYLCHEIHDQGYYCSYLDVGCSSIKLH